MVASGLVRVHGLAFSLCYINTMPIRYVTYVHTIPDALVYVLLVIYLQRRARRPLNGKQNLWVIQANTWHQN